jgi:hypothetical protein
MIIRGGGAIGAAGRGGAALCIGVTFEGAAGVGADGCAVAVGATGGVARVGTAIAGAATFVEAGVAAAGCGAVGVLGGITTTDGGR